FCGASLEPGVDIVIDAAGLPGKMRGADLCITGEGRVDAQTAFGKTPAGVASVAVRLGVPVVAIGGSVAPEAAALHERGFDALAAVVNEPMTLDEAMDPDTARRLIAFTVEQMVRCFLTGRTSAAT
ncbi:MAG: glycerate kinase, partial [Armatimonadetes bacterium]|nr:glycerate kinase [Armatimonadota bacterium]